MRFKTRTSGRPGFSLVELVIVIVIIGIIAAIAIPRVSRGSKGASESSLASNLSALRRVLELYAAEHNGDYPGAKKSDGSGTAGAEADLVDQLTMYSKGNGQTKATRDVANGFIFGPYLRKGIPPVPVGANKGNSGVAFDASNSPPVVTGGTEGWVFNPATGEIIANTDDADDSGQQTYDQY